MAGLYHERWEIELGYDEIKTEVLEREESIRSKSPTAVAQEIWGILLAYNLVRLEMERVADEAGVEPTRISLSRPSTWSATSGSGAPSPRPERSQSTFAIFARSLLASSSRRAARDHIRAQ